MEAPGAAPTGLQESPIDVDLSTSVPLDAATSKHHGTNALSSVAALDVGDHIPAVNPFDTANTVPEHSLIDSQLDRPNPFPTRTGGVTTKGCVWDILRHYPDGLALAQLVSQVINRGLREFSVKNATGTISGELCRDKAHFRRSGDGRWALTASLLAGQVSHAVGRQLSSSGSGDKLRSGNGTPAVGGSGTGCDGEGLESTDGLGEDDEDGMAGGFVSAVEEHSQSPQAVASAQTLSLQGTAAVTPLTHLVTHIDNKADGVQGAAGSIVLDLEVSALGLTLQTQDAQQHELELDVPPLAPQRLCSLNQTPSATTHAGPDLEISLVSDPAAVLDNPPTASGGGGGISPVLGTPAVVGGIPKAGQVKVPWKGAAKAAATKAANAALRQEGKHPLKPPKKGKVGTGAAERPTRARAAAAAAASAAVTAPSEEAEQSLDGDADVDESLHPPTRLPPLTPSGQETHNPNPRTLGKTGGTGDKQLESAAGKGFKSSAAGRRKGRGLHSSGEDESSSSGSDSSSSGASGDRQPLTKLVRGSATSKPNLIARSPATAAPALTSVTQRTGLPSSAASLQIQQVLSLTAEVFAPVDDVNQETAIVGLAPELDALSPFGSSCDSPDDGEPLLAVVIGCAAAAAAATAAAAARSASATAQAAAAAAAAALPVKVGVTGTDSVSLEQSPMLLKPVTLGKAASCAKARASKQQQLATAKAAKASLLAKDNSKDGDKESTPKAVKTVKRKSLQPDTSVDPGSAQAVAVESTEFAAAADPGSTLVSTHGSDSTVAAAAISGGAAKRVRRKISGGGGLVESSSMLKKDAIVADVNSIRLNTTLASTTPALSATLLHAVSTTTAAAVAAAAATAVETAPSRHPVAPTPVGLGQQQQQGFLNLPSPKPPPAAHAASTSPFDPDSSNQHVMTPPKTDSIAVTHHATIQHPVDPEVRALAEPLPVPDLYRTHDSSDEQNGSSEEAVGAVDTADPPTTVVAVTTAAAAAAAQSSDINQSSAILTASLATQNSPALVQVAAPSVPIPNPDASLLTTTVTAGVPAAAPGVASTVPTATTTPGVSHFGKRSALPGYGSGTSTVIGVTKLGGHHHVITSSLTAKVHAVQRTILPPAGAAARSAAAPSSSAASSTPPPEPAVDAARLLADLAAAGQPAEAADAATAEQLQRRELQVQERRQQQQALQQLHRQLRAQRAQHLQRAQLVAAVTSALEAARALPFGSRNGMVWVSDPALVASTCQTQTIESGPVSSAMQIPQLTDPDIKQSPILLSPNRTNTNDPSVSPLSSTPVAVLTSAVSQPALQPFTFPPASSQSALSQKLQSRWAFWPTTSILPTLTNIVTTRTPSIAHAPPSPPPPLPDDSLHPAPFLVTMHQTSTPVTHKHQNFSQYPSSLRTPPPPPFYSPLLPLTQATHGQQPPLPPIPSNLSSSPPSTAASLPSTPHLSTAVKTPFHANDKPTTYTNDKLSTYGGDRSTANASDPPVRRRNSGGSYATDVYSHGSQQMERRKPTEDRSDSSPRAGRRSGGGGSSYSRDDEDGSSKHSSYRTEDADDRRDRKDDRRSEWRDRKDDRRESDRRDDRKEDRSSYDRKEDRRNDDRRDDRKEDRRNDDRRDDKEDRRADDRRDEKRSSDRKDDKDYRDDRRDDRKEDRKEYSSSYHNKVGRRDDKRDNWKDERRGDSRRDDKRSSDSRRDKDREDYRTDKEDYRSDREDYRSDSRRDDDEHKDSRDYKDSRREDSEYKDSQKEDADYKDSRREVSDHKERHSTRQDDGYSSRPDHGGARRVEDGGVAGTSGTRVGSRREGTREGSDRRDRGDSDSSDSDPDPQPPRAHTLVADNQQLGTHHAGGDSLATSSPAAALASVNGLQDANSGQPGTTAAGTLVTIATSNGDQRDAKMRHADTGPNSQSLPHSGGAMNAASMHAASAEDNRHPHHSHSLAPTAATAAAAADLTAGMHPNTTPDQHIPVKSEPDALLYSSSSIHKPESGFNQPPQSASNVRSIVGPLLQPIATALLSPATAPTVTQPRWSVHLDTDSSRLLVEYRTLPTATAIKPVLVSAQADGGMWDDGSPSQAGGPSLKRASAQFQAFGSSASVPSITIVSASAGTATASGQLAGGRSGTVTIPTATGWGETARHVESKLGSTLTLVKRRPLLSHLHGAEDGIEGVSGSLPSSSTVPSHTQSPAAQRRQSMSLEGKADREALQAPAAAAAAAVTGNKIQQQQQLQDKGKGTRNGSFSSLEGQQRGAGGGGIKRQRRHLSSSSSGSSTSDDSSSDGSSSSGGGSSSDSSSGSESRRRHASRRGQGSAPHSGRLSSNPKDTATAIIRHRSSVATAAGCLILGGSGKGAEVVGSQRGTSNSSATAALPSSHRQNSSKLSRGKQQYTVNGSGDLSKLLLPQLQPRSSNKPTKRTRIQNGDEEQHTVDSGSPIRRSQGSDRGLPASARKAALTVLPAASRWTSAADLALQLQQPAADAAAAPPSGTLAPSLTSSSWGPAGVAATAAAAAGSSKPASSMFEDDDDDDPRITAWREDRRNSRAAAARQQQLLLQQPLSAHPPATALLPGSGAANSSIHNHILGIESPHPPSVNHSGQHSNRSPPPAPAPLLLSMHTVLSAPHASQKALTASSGSAAAAASALPLADPTLNRLVTTRQQPINTRQSGSDRNQEHSQNPRSDPSNQDQEDPTLGIPPRNTRPAPDSQIPESGEAGRRGTRSQSESASLTPPAQIPKDGRRLSSGSQQQQQPQPERKHSSSGAVPNPHVTVIDRQYNRGIIFNYSNDTMHEVMEHGRFGHNDKDTMCDISITTLVFFWNFERSLLHGPYRRATAARSSNGSSSNSGKVVPVEIETYSSKEWRFKFACKFEKVARFPGLPEKPLLRVTRFYDESRKLVRTELNSDQCRQLYLAFEDHVIRKEKERSQREAAASVAPSTPAPSSSTLLPSPAAATSLSCPAPTHQPGSAALGVAPAASGGGGGRTSGRGTSVAEVFSDHRPAKQSVPLSTSRSQSLSHAEEKELERGAGISTDTAVATGRGQDRERGKGRERSRLHVSASGAHTDTRDSDLDLEQSDHPPSGSARRGSSSAVGSGDADSPRAGRSGGGSADGKSRGKRGREEFEGRDRDRDRDRDSSGDRRGDGRDDGGYGRDRYRSRGGGSGGGGGPEKDRESEREKSARRGGVEAEGVPANTVSGSEIDVKLQGSNAD